MKKVLAAFCLMALAATPVLASTVPGTGVLGSKHDMNTIDGAVDDAQGRVCAFCHTPHHAIDRSVATNADYLPLWSHTVQNSTNFAPYESPTIDAMMEPDILTGPSRLCMSCHDGTIAIDTHYSFTGEKMLDQDGWESAGIAINGNLTNDHPIGFDYNAVAGGKDDQPSGSTTGGIDKYINDPNGRTYLGNDQDFTIADRLFNGSIMTCATCHDVHNKKNAANATGPNYFVLAPQEESQLCRTCHIK